MFKINNDRTSGFQAEATLRSSPQHTEFQEVDKRVWRRCMPADRPRRRFGRRKRSGRKDAGQSLDRRRQIGRASVLTLRQGKHGRKVIGTALFIRQAFPVGICRMIVAMCLRVNVFAVTSGRTAHHICMPVLPVIMYIQSGHGEHIPYHEQHGRQDVDGVGYETFPIHCCKGRKKKAQIPIPIYGYGQIEDN